jgi:predicted adenylyl cyclase CyaB
MPRNIEIKARITRIDNLLSKAAAIADQGPIEIAQDDTFFHCDSGRLKLRTLSRSAGQLIFYRRANQQGPKESFYHVTPTTEPDSLRETLSLAYGQIGRVQKQRTLFLAGRTRIHFDLVEGLGHFLELEVVLEDDESLEAGMQEARDIMGHLNVSQSQLIEGAYLDLLAKQPV